MRSWIKQDPKKHNCGQIAIAVIGECSLEEAIKIVGKKGSTTTKDLAKALRKLRFRCPDRCKKMPKPLLGLGQLRSSSRKSGWHWVVVDGDKIFDGANGFPDGRVHWKDDWKITSYLPIYK